MRIGELAAATGVEVETVRYYEKAGLLRPPKRSANGYRAYGPAQLERLAFVRHCRSLDMALDEIRVLLRFQDTPGENCAEVNNLLDQHIGHVAERVRELRTLEKLLKELRVQCQKSHVVEHCGILKGLTSAARKPAVAVATRSRHVRGAHR